MLNAPFAEIAEELGFPKFTQRGMRRTYNDLSRAAGVLDLVTRSISGKTSPQPVLAPAFRQTSRAC